LAITIQLREATLDASGQIPAEKAELYQASGEKRWMELLKKAVEMGKGMK
jgi:hypothetical protein